VEAINEYWSWTGLFSRDVCKSIIDSYYKEEASQIGQIGFGSSTVVKPTTRTTKLCWISPDEHISSILLNKALIANQKAGWNFHVDSIESVQIGKYDSGCHYDWHCDGNLLSRVNGAQRKISVVVMLSDSNDYEGGSLEFNQNNPTAVPNIQGSVYVFPSLSLHRVAPVTKGVRYSLAAWCGGPAFR